MCILSALSLIAMRSACITQEMRAKDMPHLTADTHRR